MLVLVTYDVNTETSQGEKRLRQVAKYCEKYGQRVQNSVFECSLDATQFIKFKAGIRKLINLEEDNIRFYNLGNKYETKVEAIGRETRAYDQTDILVL